MGVYLNADNKSLDACQNRIDTKMKEVCGSTADCNAFAADDTIGTRSLSMQKVGDIYRIQGMISFGLIDFDDEDTPANKSQNADRKRVGGVNKELFGKKTIAGYLSNIGAPGKESIVSSINMELDGMVATINRAVDLIATDTEIGYCINGRDMSNVTGAQEKTTARYPNLLDSTKRLIATAALRKAEDNYNKKFNELVATATQSASADVAEYMCRMIPMNGASSIKDVSSRSTLTTPYAISYDVAAGFTADELANVRGSSTSTMTGPSIDRHGSAKNTAYKAELPGGTKSTWAIFNREDRSCKVCTEFISKKCSTYGYRGMKMKCVAEQREENCQDVKM
jgi:hypothetical protein